jgi:hypothetical protein
LRHAADIKDRIDSLQAELSEILGGEFPTYAVTGPLNGRRKRRRMSAAGRAAIAAAARARWAKVKGEAPSNGRAPGRKRKFSSAGRRALSLAAKARWARAKAQGKSRL